MSSPLADDEGVAAFICVGCGQDCEDQSYAKEYLCPDCHHAAADAAAAEEREDEETE